MQPLTFDISHKQSIEAMPLASIADPAVAGFNGMKSGVMQNEKDKGQEGKGEKWRTVNKEAVAVGHTYLEWQTLYKAVTLLPVVLWSPVIAVRLQFIHRLFLAYSFVAVS